MSKIKVTVEKIYGYCDLPMLVGDHFFIEGSKIIIPKGRFICMWALQSMMPIFPIFNARNKLEDEHWVKKVKHFACPDPNGRVIYRVELVEADKN